MAGDVATKLIAVVDDEPDILELVEVALSRAAFRVKTFSDSAGFLNSLVETAPDLIILDLMLPDADGLDICKQLKGDERYAHIPLIMLTARGDETDRVLGLELGADDYVPKPFSPKELVARVKAVLRRSGTQGRSHTITIGGSVVVDLERYVAVRDNEKLDLTLTEFRLLRMLAEQPGRVFTRNQILDTLWGQDKAVIDRTVDVHITHLREKLGPVGKCLKNVRGVGYKLEV